MIFGDYLGLIFLPVSSSMESEIYGLDTSVILSLQELYFGICFPSLTLCEKTLKMEQRGAVSWVLEWILKSLEGVELHQDADKKSSS